MWHIKLNKCDSGVVGNARPCQGRDRGFEPRLSLLFDEKGHPERMSFFVERAPSGAQSSSVSVPLRSAQSRCPPDTLRRLSLLFNKKGKIKSQQRLDNQLIFMIAYKQILGSSSHQGYDVVLFVITQSADVASGETCRAVHM